MIARNDLDLECAAAAYLHAPNAGTRERLCEAGLPLVRRMAMSVLRRLPPHFGLDDLVGDGCVGLLRAIDRFDPRIGLCFEAWAARLIRGAMLNGLRSMDIVPERVRRDARNLDWARWRLAQAHGSAPTDRAAAVRAGLTQRKLAAVLLALRRSTPISLDVPPPQQTDQPFTASLGERVPAATTDPGDDVARRMANAQVAQAVRSLPAREQLIISSFYSGGFTFRAIGGRLGISKQRVSQIHGRAIASLRTLLAPVQSES
ncbi:MAG TPA: sigma-70 family RNA polymerase sigma factor [Candidatus Acidoferrales bacterium]|nr:sigma-70 family RNA polymerase sigma factor [Candidatus Acidoferrales bacterium]